MAYFFINKCDYQNCTKTFPTLYDLIIHIEDTHIDFNPKVIEETENQKPQCLPLSYVLRYSQEERKVYKYVNENVENATNSECTGSNLSLNYSGGLKKEAFPVHMDSDMSDDSFDSCKIIKKKKNMLYNYRCSRWIASGIDLQKTIQHDLKPKIKKFSCPIAGCIKKYKNPNGMKYHIMNYHDIKESVTQSKKEFKCECGKDYKTARGLKSHVLLHKQTHRNNKLSYYKVNPFYNSKSLPLLNQHFSNLYKNTNDCINYTTLDTNTFADIGCKKNENTTDYCSPQISPRDESIYNNSVFSDLGFERHSNTF